MQEVTIRRPTIEDKYNLIKLLIPQFKERTDASLDADDYSQKWLANFELMLTSNLVHIFVTTNQKFGACWCNHSLSFTET